MMEHDTGTSWHSDQIRRVLCRLCRREQGREAKISHDKRGSLYVIYEYNIDSFNPLS